MNTTPSQRLGFLHHIRLVPLFACWICPYI
ncbi:hypothetical protein, partial [Escherichia coli]